MAETANRDPNRPPSHPGEVIADILLDHPSVSKSRAARDIGISRQHFHDLLARRKPVTPATASRLGAYFGNGPALWLRLQANHDAWKAEREFDVSDVKPLHAA